MIVIKMIFKHQITKNIFMIQRFKVILILLNISVQILLKIFTYKVLFNLYIMIKIIHMLNIKSIDVLMKHKKKLFANLMKKLINGFKQKHFGLVILIKDLI